MEKKTLPDVWFMCLKYIFFILSNVVEWLFKQRVMNLWVIFLKHIKKILKKTLFVICIFYVFIYLFYTDWIE